MADYLISVRNLKRGEFGENPGTTRFLLVPAGENPAPGQAIGQKTWVEGLLKRARTTTDPLTGKGCGDIAVLIHGYNTSPPEVIARHRQMQRDLGGAGFAGTLVSFDWPSDDRAINYLEDRSDAKKTALKLVDDGIALLAATRFRGCEINLHVIAHSMGCYVLREAFDDADDRPAIAASNWNVSQICLIGADVSSRSMAASDARSRSLYRHCTRLTNYQNPYDAVLKLSDVKRAGVAPRAGRRGLPDDAPDKAVNVNCGDYFKRHYLDPKKDPKKDTHENGHAWYFEDPVFLADLVQTLAGNLDRRVVARRRSNERGQILLA
ncbi:MAG TPA: alpha/beta fold hydrolase [Woeseiaceae bacterium]|nr:alpha/beta fold hydrolase [Woeseiaceae bacterium]